MTGAPADHSQPRERIARLVAEYTDRVTACMRAAGMTDEQIAEIDAGADRVRARDRLCHIPLEAQTAEMLAAAGYPADPDYVDPARLADALSCRCRACRAWLDSLPACGCGVCDYCAALADTGRKLRPSASVLVPRRRFARLEQKHGARAGVR
jgi:hypothetical protein